MADEKPAETEQARRYSFSGSISVDGVVPPGFPITYSDYVTVQSTGYEYLVTFFQLDIPLLEAKDAEAFEKNPKVRAHCVARIAVPLHAGDLLLEGLQG